MPKEEHVWECKTEKRHGFSRCSRIGRQDGFSNVLKYLVVSKQWFSIYALANDSGFARLGVNVGKRSVPKAVQRNRIKRMVRETFRTLDKRGLELDFVVRLRGNIDKANFSEAKTLLEHAFQTILSRR